MQRYQPRIRVALADDDDDDDDDDADEGESGGDGGGDRAANDSNRSSAIVCRHKTFTFPETQFMAVTAYQNHRVRRQFAYTTNVARQFR